MALDDRPRRRPPERPGPRRAVIPDAEGLNGKLVEAAPATAADTIVGGVVSAAYKVVEDNIQEGRRAAERLRGAGRAPGGAAPGARVVAERLMHMTRDLGYAWVDLIGAIAKEPEVRAVIERLTSHDRGQATPARPSPTSPTPVTQRVISRKPVEVTLSPLPPLGPTSAPGIAGLHALNPASPPISQVAFTRRGDGGLELALAIPHDQPVDTYWGTLVDVDSRQPIGTLTVRILE